LTVSCIEQAKISPEFEFGVKGQGHQGQKNDRSAAFFSGAVVAGAVLWGLA